MPQYLAPGVYVEETSFRSKSIEGVGTSTSGFVGPTRTGPVGETPELLTSFSDFERIYGGLDDLSFGTNYLAHAVRAYFNEGGSRLYVSRVFSGNGGNTAQSSQLVSGAEEAEQVRFMARFPGSGGNGRVIVTQVATPVVLRVMESLPEGSIVRVGGLGTPAAAAMLTGSAGPFALPPGGQLALTVGGADSEVTFMGESAEVVAADPLPDDVNLAAETTLTVTIDGVAQTITLAAGTRPRDQFVSQLNSALRGGYARLTETGELAIGSDTRGSASSVSVSGGGLPILPDGSASADPADNNVADLAAVTADEINALLTGEGIPARAAIDAATGHLVLSTTATGDTASVVVRDDPESIASALGLATAVPAVGTAGPTVTYFVRGSGGYRDSGNNPLNTAGLGPFDAPSGGAEVLTVTVTVEDEEGRQIVYEGLGLDPTHPRYIGTVLAQSPTRRYDALVNPYYLQIGGGVSAFELRDALFGATESREITVSGGADGAEPNEAAYSEALQQFLQLEDIAIVAAPGSSAYADYQAIQGALIIHAETRRTYRIAVLDSRPGLVLSEVREQRSRMDSKYAAFYYPWVVVSNPLANPSDDRIPREIALPPSGFLCGIYARNDVERGVHKAPANEVVRSAIRFESDINFAQQEVLNPLGINCLRFFPGRGFRVWGARTTSSDPEFKYVSDRRYMNYLEHSIDRGTQWAVFEPNGERLWSNITDTVSAFLYNEWVNGALLGSSQKEAFFVRCDRSTMTQNDLDNGRLICLIGVALIKPAEFVIFRIGQKTADARS